jgi:hypothetical protein
LAYVASLEERLRGYEQNGVQANIHLQKLAKKLDLENRKLKKVLLDTFGLGDPEIERAEPEALVEEIRSRLGGQPTEASKCTTSPSRSSSFSGGVIATNGYTPFSACCYPSAPLSDIRSQKPPTPPPTKDDKEIAGELLLQLAPQTAPNCGEGLNQPGKRFCGLLQLLAAEANAKECKTRAVPCRVSYDLLKSLIDEQDSLAMENAVFELRDGVLRGKDGPCIDAKALTKVLNRLTGPSASAMMVDA